MHKLPEMLEVLVRTGRAEAMLRAMQCAWRFHWWSHPNGRAFALLMCTLKARMHPGGVVRLDTTTCTLSCGGSDPPIDVLASGPYMV